MKALNKQQCELRGGVKLSDAAFAELVFLAEYCEMYADPGAAGRRAPLFMAPDFRTADNLQVLHELVTGVQEVWRASGGQGNGTWRDNNDRDRNGALVRLLSSMFEQVGVKSPSPRTLRRAIQVLNNR